MPAWLGPLIGAGASLLGSLFGKKEQPQQTSNRVDYKQMVKDAEAAGFNPLTVLRAGGASGYTTTSHPALSSVNPFGSVMEAVGNFAMNFDSQADKRRQAEYDLVQAQIASIQTETEQRRASMNAPKRAGATTRDAYGRPLSDGSLTPIVASPALAAGDKKFDMGQITVTNPWGGRYWVDPTVGDAQHLEDRYGEPGSWLGGVGVMAADAAYNLKKSAPLGSSKGFNATAADVWSDPVKYMDKFNKWVEKDLSKPWAW